MAAVVVVAAELDVAHSLCGHSTDALFDHGSWLARVSATAAAGHYMSRTAEQGTGGGPGITGHWRGEHNGDCGLNKAVEGASEGGLRVTGLSVGRGARSHLLGEGLVLAIDS